MRLILYRAIADKHLTLTELLPCEILRASEEHVNCLTPPSDRGSAVAVQN